MQQTSGASADKTQATFPRRPYGRHAQELSIIGFGGLLVAGLEQDRANRLVGEMVERGINYFDVAPTYGDAEVHLGPALQPYRKNVFLACKTEERTAAGARAKFEQSLANLHTDYFDLYQLHAIQYLDKDVDGVFAAGGAMEVLLQAKKDGRVRHLGFSAHSVEAALAAMDRYDFDSVLFPVNFATFHQGHFGAQIMAKAQSKGVARLALKGLARQPWPKDDPQRSKYPKCWYQPLSDPHEADLALRFTLGQPITAAIPPGDESLFRMALEIAQRFTPLNEAERQELQEMAGRMGLLFQYPAA